MSETLDSGVQPLPVTLTVTAVHDAGGDHTGAFDVTFGSSYPDGGYTVDAASFNRVAIHGIVPVPTGTANRIVTYDPSTSTNGRLRLWKQVGVETAIGSDESATSCRLYVFGPHA